MTVVIAQNDAHVGGVGRLPEGMVGLAGAPRGTSGADGRRGQSPHPTLLEFLVKEEGVAQLARFHVKQQPGFLPSSRRDDVLPRTA